MDPLQQLLAGFARFRDKYFDEDPTLFAQLASEGQSPKVAVVACCDSRVDPAIITECAPGDLFIIRNVANLVPPYEPEGTYHGTSAALEFAVRGLGVEHIIILGHAQCGGIRALIGGSGLPADSGKADFINTWVSIAEPARQRVFADPALTDTDQRARACELEAIRVSLQNLMSFPWIREAVESDKLKLHGWYFNIESGQMLQYDHDRGEFQS